MILFNKRRGCGYCKCSKDLERLAELEAARVDEAEGSDEQNASLNVGDEIDLDPLAFEELTEEACFTIYNVFTDTKHDRLILASMAVMIAFIVFRVIEQDEFQRTAVYSHSY